ncbi:UNKNOWN [Stylonychia lemnae]|uniref:Uncharacterized protein n=1 Tax=Stylonychia lemnae TaxID=5949 RepID=A0A078AN43_STYLE|nr:UNKNOWN [Stylonychia lemnae]|eukprot:CDW82777.1 UNKNOWN [Stylonychia lemnae]
MTSLVETYQKQYAVITKPEFVEYIQFLRFLKLTENPAIISLEPKICFACWSIFTKNYETRHLGHQQTKNFKVMAEANADSIISLKQKYLRYDSEQKTVEKFQVDQEFMNIIRKEFSSFQASEQQKQREQYTQQQQPS